MNKIYLEISKLGDKFRTMCYGITKDKERIDDAVQELFLYLMQMNPDVLKTIYEKDGIDGIIRYGAVVLKRALTSKRSPFYYKYEKYYSHIDSASYSSSTTFSRDDVTYNVANNKNIANLPNQEESEQWKKLQQIDVILDKQNWYDKKIFELYYYEEGNTLDSLAKKTKISRNSLFTTIDKVRAILKKELADE